MEILWTMIIILPFIPGVINYIYISPCVMDFGTKNSCNACDQNNKFALGMKMLSLWKMSKLWKEEFRNISSGRWRISLFKENTHPWPSKDLYWTMLGIDFIYLNYFPSRKFSSLRPLSISLKRRRDEIYNKITGE